MKIIKKWLDLPHKGGVCLLGLALIFNSGVSAKTRSKEAMAGSPSVASTSLCGDSYVLAIVPDHIKALSWQSRDRLSTANPAQKTLPQIWNDPEVLATISADIIIFGPGESAYADQLSHQSLVLNWGEDIETVRKNAKAITDIMGLSPDWVDGLDARLKDIPHRSIPPKALYLSRSGGTAGPGTFVDTAITLAGGQNVITSPGWQTPDPEIILTLNPDIIITSYLEDGYESVQATTVRHQAMRNFVQDRPSIDIPGALWPCAGPGLIDATLRISKAFDHLSLDASERAP